MSTDASTPDDGPPPWDDVYSSKAADELSWFQAEPELSLRLLTQACPRRGALVDVGAGVSTVADRLVEQGWDDVTVLDVSRAAVEAVRSRLADAVTCVVHDVLTWRPDRRFDVWHDRAVFHFLTEPADQRRYVDAAAAALRPRGALILATFAPDGPLQCSGRPTARWDAAGLARTFGSAFVLERSQTQAHETPWACVQQFTWAVLRRRSD